MSWLLPGCLSSPEQTKIYILVIAIIILFIVILVAIATTSSPGTGRSPGATFTLFLYGFQLLKTWSIFWSDTNHTNQEELYSTLFGQKVAVFSGRHS